jgi:hypothetical protein
LPRTPSSAVREMLLDGWLGFSSLFSSAGTE